RRGRPALADAPVPHPDRRRPADGAAARGQPGPGDRPGARRRARRHPVPAHQRLRRGDRAAQREGGAACAAPPARAPEPDPPATAAPFAGSYAIESMTDDLEAAANELIARVEDLGGAVAAIERGFQKAEIERSAYQIARQIDDGERVVVGVNKFISAGD